MASRRRRSESDSIARERIEILFDRAEEFFPSDRTLSMMCIDRARTIAMRRRMRMPERYRRKFCRRCSSYLVSGSTLRVRVHKGRVVMTCLECGCQRRIPVSKKVN